MGKVAIIFPGQGSQSVGMGQDLCHNFAPAKKVFEEADGVLGRSVSRLCFEGPEEELKLTINTQPAILATSIAAFESFKSACDIEFDYAAGHSLGEYGALYAAGVLGFEDVMKLISKRAEVMNGAAQNTTGAMSAVLGMSPDAIQEVLKSVDGIVSVANYNSPDQTVITGEAEAVQKAGELLSQSGAKRVIPLPVSGAFHSGLMKGAAEEFAAYLDGFTLNDASVEVLTNVDAQATTLAAEFKSKMPEQIYSSVMWVQTIEKLKSLGVDTFIEVGPGKVLAGLNKKMGLNTYNVYDKASLDATIAGLMALSN